MSEEQDLEQIEISLEAAKKHQDLYKSLQILKNNVHFKKVFGDYYLDKYALRLVMLKASMGTQDEKNQANIKNQLDAIGHMNQFMLFIEQEGMLADKAIEDFESEKDTILTEEVRTDA